MRDKGKGLALEKTGFRFKDLLRESGVCVRSLMNYLNGTAGELVTIKVEGAIKKLQHENNGLQQEPEQQATVSD